jgi:hypothetical protein
MATVPATGQFGPPLFSVLSRKGVLVDAKWLTAEGLTACRQRPHMTRARRPRRSFHLAMQIMSVACWAGSPGRRAH